MNYNNNRIHDVIVCIKFRNNFDKKKCEFRIISEEISENEMRARGGNVELVERLKVVHTLKVKG